MGLEQSPYPHQPWQSRHYQQVPQALLLMQAEIRHVYLDPQKWDLSHQIDHDHHRLPV